MRAWLAPQQMPTGAIEAETAHLSTLADHEALIDPLTLGVHLGAGAVVARAHLRVIAAAIVDMYRGRYDRLLILTPPQVGKSTLTAVYTPLWWLAQRPTDRVAVASYANSLAINRGKAVRRLVIDHGHRYGLALQAGSSAANDWELTTGGGMISVGVGAGFTGRGADLIIVDDPHKDRAEAESHAIRDAIGDWWSAVVTTRLAPAAPVCIIQTRWHVDDLAGRLLADEGTIGEGGRWKVIRLPAFADRAADPLGRPMGGPLPHPRVAVTDTTALLAHWEGKRRDMAVRDFFALCQADPQPVEGALLTERALRAARDPFPTASPLLAAVAVDPSGGGRSTAGIVGGWLGDDGRLYIAVDASGHMDVEVWPVRVCETVLAIDADRVVVETNYGGKMATLVIRSAWAELARTRPEFAARMMPRIVVVNARKNKLLRAEPVAHQLMVDRIRLVGAFPDLEKEWVTWQPTDPDSPGRIDASVHLAYALLTPPKNTVAQGGSATDVSRQALAGQPGRRGRPTELPHRRPGTR